jgi:pyruvate-formate lyase-activating enzyme
MADILLINPWIEDFAVYDLWAKPLGLLYIADIFIRNGMEAELLDLTDRNSSLLEKPPPAGKWGTGAYRREIIEKPRVLEHIPRYFSRYGAAYDAVAEYLSGLEPPKIILITSMMTYWYTGVKRTVDLCREVFPGVPVVLGGVYATLMPEHAARTIKPDLLLTGAFRGEHLEKIASLIGKNLKYPDSETVEPAWHLYRKLDYLLISTGSGCPFRCAFCAVHLLAEKFERKSVSAVYGELIRNVGEFKVRDIAFIDDALLVNRKNFIIPLLKKTAELGAGLRFHTPNGLHARYIDSELAALFRNSGVTTVNLSFETVNEEQFGRVDGKVSVDDFLRAFEVLVKAGYKESDIRVYLMLALPGQSWEETLRSIEFVHSLGALVGLNAWSPIPGTEDYKEAVKKGFWREENDPLLGNPTVLPVPPDNVTYSDYLALMTAVKEKNNSNKMREAVAPGSGKGN